MAQIARVVGIDVSKGKLDWKVRQGAGGVIDNTPSACARLAREFCRLGVSVAVLEASGGYERTMVAALRRAGVAARVVDPKRVRRFADAAGRHAKNDPIDAEMIAWFGEVFPQETTVAPDPERERLAALVADRHDFVALSVQLGNRGEHPGSPVGQRHRVAALKQLQRAIAALDAAIAQQIAQTPQLAEEARLLASVPGLGTQSIAALLAWLPELGRIGSRQLAALVGVAPYDDDSGNRRGARHIAGGRHELRNALYMPTVGAATRHNPVLMAFYRRLRANGKPGKVALIACMRKLIGILNAMIARRETWNPALQPNLA